MLTRRVLHPVRFAGSAGSLRRMHRLRVLSPQRHPGSIGKYYPKQMAMPGYVTIAAIAILLC